MKMFAKSVFAALCLTLMVAFVPAFGVTAYAKTYSGGETAEVTNLHVNDILEEGVILHCPDTHALSLYVDSIWNYATNPYTTTKRCWVEKAVSHNNTSYLLQVSTYFPGVTGVTLDKEEITLGAGTFADLTATVLPEKASNKTVTWSSGDETIATVDQSGKVRAVAEGTVTVTVTTSDGGYQASCSVNVLPAASGVTVNPAELSLKVGGDPVTLAATVAPANAFDKTVTWSSSNESVATVDQSGMVTPVGKGSAVIAVTTAGGSFTAECSVTVKLPVLEVLLDPGDLTMKVGQAAGTLTATVLPEDADDKTVSWSSDNTEVVTVENGVVRAVAKGKATIAVTTNDGNLSAVCHVTVIQPVTGVSLTPSGIFMVVGGEPGKLKADVTPNNADNKSVTWSSSNESVATVDENGNVTAVGTGTSTVTVTTADGGYTASCVVNAIDPSTATFAVIKGDKQSCNDQNVEFAFRFLEDTTDEYDYVSDFGSALLSGDSFEERALADGEFGVREGSLLLTINKTFIKELKPGAYTLTVSLQSGQSASATFTVTQRSGIHSPNTGDNVRYSSLVCVWIFFLMSLTLIAYEVLRNGRPAVPAGIAAFFCGSTGSVSPQAEATEAETAETETEAEATETETEA